jgi:endonuclease/exonuclease/phosphatase family metal-dependent hydrolase
VFVVHHKSGGPAAYWREAESKAVLGLVQEVTMANRDRAVLILGDFNAQPRDASVKTYLDNGFHDIFAKHAQSPAIITHESGRRIDLILANDAAMAQLLTDRAFVLGTAARPQGVNWRDMPTFTGMASDHYPTVVDIAPVATPQSEAPGG